MRVLSGKNGIAQYAVLLLLLSAGSALATTVHVPGDRPSIHAGIHLASDGDTVLVAPGTYVGEGNRTIRFFGKAIGLLSEGGPTVTTVDCEGQATGFVFDAGEDSLAVVDGFTVVNGASSLGGAMFFRDGSCPLIANCRFINSQATFGGAVCCLFDAGPTFRYCDFVGCHAEQYGGALYCSDAVARARGCTGNHTTGRTMRGSVPKQRALQCRWCCRRL